MTLANNEEIIEQFINDQVEETVEEFVCDKYADFLLRMPILKFGEIDFDFNVIKNRFFEIYPMLLGKKKADFQFDLAVLECIFEVLVNERLNGKILDTKSFPSFDMTHQFNLNAVEDIEEKKEAGDVVKNDIADMVIVENSACVETDNNKDLKQNVDNFLPLQNKSFSSFSGLTSLFGMFSNARQHDYRHANEERLTQSCPSLLGKAF